MTIRRDIASVKFELQRAQAFRRGIAWEFTLDEWIAVWEESGKWELRGRGKGKYVMSRHADVGPYAPSNVSIILFEQNLSDSYKNGRHEERVAKLRKPGRPCFTFETPPVAVEPDVLDDIDSYRDAVRACWAARRRPAMTMRTLAELIGAAPCHISDYFAEDDAKGRRDLPAKLIPEFEWVCGHTIVSQWLAAQLGVMRAEVQADRLAA